MEKRISALRANIDKMNAMERNVLGPVLKSSKAMTVSIGKLLRSAFDMSPWLLPLIEGLLHAVICTYAMSLECYRRGGAGSYNSFRVCCTAFMMRALGNFVVGADGLISKLSTVFSMYRLSGTPWENALEMVSKLWRTSYDKLYPLLERTGVMLGPLTAIMMRTFSRADSEELWKEVTTMAPKKLTQLIAGENGVLHTAESLPNLTRTMLSFVGSFLSPHIFRVFTNYTIVSKNAPQWKKDAFNLALVIRLLCGEFGRESSDPRDFKPACHAATVLMQTPLWKDVVLPRVMEIADVAKRASRRDHPCFA
tara:strand:- start:4243 stop:5169 length:927 start_codon:yes stop_codon:yes gene_type:complete